MPPEYDTVIAGDANDARLAKLLLYDGGSPPTVPNHQQDSTEPPANKAARQAAADRAANGIFPAHTTATVANPQAEKASGGGTPERARAQQLLEQSAAAVAKVEGSFKRLQAEGRLSPSAPSTSAPEPPAATGLPRWLGEGASRSLGAGATESGSRWIGAAIAAESDDPYDDPRLNPDVHFSPTLETGYEEGGSSPIDRPDSPARCNGGSRGGRMVPPLLSTAQLSLLDDLSPTLRSLAPTPPSQSPRSLSPAPVERASSVPSLTHEPSSPPQRVASTNELAARPRVASPLTTSPPKSASPRAPQPMPPQLPPSVASMPSEPLSPPRLLRPIAAPPPPTPPLRRGRDWRQVGAGPADKQLAPTAVPEFAAPLPPPRQQFQPPPRQEFKPIMRTSPAFPASPPFPNPPSTPPGLASARRFSPGLDGFALGQDRSPFRDRSPLRDRPGSSASPLAGRSILRSPSFDLRKASQKLLDTITQPFQCGFQCVQGRGVQGRGKASGSADVRPERPFSR